jgi:hypothetical protein
MSLALRGAVRKAIATAKLNSRRTILVFWNCHKGLHSDQIVPIGSPQEFTFSPFCS